MNTIIDADAAKLAGLQIDTLQKVRSGQITLGQWEWFNNLSMDDREARFGDVKKTKLEPSLDFAVRVDRSVKPKYPDWVKKGKLWHPELECFRPAEYNLRTVKPWLHDDQKYGWVLVSFLLNKFKESNASVSCLSLQDGFAIQQKGLAVFRKLFAGKAVFLWGSIAQDINGDLYSPCLFERGDEVMMNWSWLTGYWDLNFLVFSFGDWKKPEPAHKEAPDEESSVT